MQTSAGTLLTRSLFGCWQPCALPRLPRAVSSTRGRVAACQRSVCEPKRGSQRGSTSSTNQEVQSFLSWCFTLGRELNHREFLRGDSECTVYMQQYVRLHVRVRSYGSQLYILSQR
ncbi:unnamed protein product [Ectocarpus sp. 4 AP-2014]